MIEPWYLLIAFALGWWTHPDYTDAVTIRDGCKVSVARLHQTQTPPGLPDQISPLDMYLTIPLYNEALLSCNVDKAVVYKEIKSYNDKVEAEANTKE